MSWDNAQLITEARHQGTQHRNKITLLATSFAVVNRVPTVHLEVHRENVIPASSLPMEVWLPEQEDYDALHLRMVVLVERLMVQELAYFDKFKDVVCYHIPHKYTKEMAQQSLVVSCTT